MSTKFGRCLDWIEHNNNWCELLRRYILLDLHNGFCYVAGNFFSTVHALISYFDVSWHLTMKLFPAKISEQATMQNPWCQRATVQCYPWMLTVWEIYFHTSVLKKGFLFFMGHIKNHLKTGPSGNSWVCFPHISTFPSAPSQETKLMLFLGTSH